MRLGAAAAAPPGNLLPEGVEGSAQVSPPADAVTPSPPVGGQLPSDPAARLLAGPFLTASAAAVELCWLDPLI